MSELVPGTPEYQEAYDKEMQRLEAEAKPVEKVEAPEKPEAKTPSDDEKPDDELAKVRKELEVERKRVADTQRWAHQNAERIKRLEREQEERKRNETRPAILDANPGLEDAIKHVAAPTEPAQPPQQGWLDAVATALPDVEDLLNNKAFYDAAQARRNALGAEWDEPLKAIRELSALRTEHVAAQRQEAAKEAARKDYEAKAHKRSAMSVPGGAAGRDVSAPVDEVQKVWGMSDADFRAQRAKVMGY